MDQKKIGAYLKHLRKSKGLTQEQLAERFFVSAKTVSRWETGNNMPDVAMLIALATFYDIDIREIIDGERINEPMERTSEETLQKVAAYAAQQEKSTHSKVVHIALGVCVLLLICTFLFHGENHGLLYGVVPKSICNGIVWCAYGLAAALLVSYIKAYLWQEKPSQEPEKTVMATVVSKEVKPGTHHTGRSKGGYSYVVYFLTEDGQTLELYAYEIEFGGLRKGMYGELTFRDRYYLSFSEADPHT